MRNSVLNVLVCCSVVLCVGGIFQNKVIVDDRLERLKEREGERKEIVEIVEFGICRQFLIDDRKGGIRVQLVENYNFGCIILLSV